VHCEQLKLSEKKNNKRGLQKTNAAHLASVKRNRQATLFLTEKKCMANKTIQTYKKKGDPYESPKT